MNIEDINTTCFILALIIRDDGERILLGDGFYEFKDSLQHFQPNIFQNDIVELQGTDGQLLAGQVRRTASQPFDGFIGDATTNRELIEQKRREFIAFFRKKHYYTVVYIFPNGATIQRERGYIVDAPSAPEMWQKFPEYHIALNFEDPNYYEYEEDESGAEIYAHDADIRILADFSGGLVWDYFGAVSDEKTWIDWKNGTTVDGLYTFNNGLAGAPLEFTQLDGNATQHTTTGKNLIKFDDISGTNATIGNYFIDRAPQINTTLVAGHTYTFSANMTIGGSVSQCRLSVGNGSSGYAGDLVIARDLTSGRVVLTFTPTAEELQVGTKFYLRFPRFGEQVTTGVNYSLTQVMLEESASATAYESYTGAAPSPNPDYPQTVNVVSGGQEVRITGENLLPPTQDFNVDHNGLVFECINGRFTANGNASSGSQSPTWATISPYIVKEGDYFHLGNSTGGATRVHIALVFSDGSIANYSPNVAHRIESLSHRVGRAIVGIRFYYNSGYEIEADFEPMILHNISTYTEYEPYKEQRCEIDLGKNLWGNFSSDLTSSLYGISYTSKADGTIEVGSGTVSGSTSYSMDSTTARNNGRIVNLKAGTYTVSGGTNKIFVAVISSTGQQVAMSDASNTYKTFTLTADTGVFVRVQIPNGTVVDSTTIKPMLEASPYPTTYAPYKTPIELAGVGEIQPDALPKYRDGFKYENGTWYIHKEVGKVVLDGSIGGYNSASEWFYIGYSSLGIGDGVLDGGVKSDYFTMDAYSHMNANITIDGLIATSGTHIVLRNLACTDAATYKTWLSTHNTTVYYALATPTDTQITEPELLAQLNAIASTFEGVNNITITPSAGAQGEISIHYATGALDVGAGYEWELGTVNPQNIITVEGIDRTLPIWEVQGPATNPTLTNATTNQSITWEGTVPSGQTLTVDMANQTATMEGANVFAGIEGEWIELAVGNNIISYTATGATEPSKLKWNGVVG